MGISGTVSGVIVTRGDVDLDPVLQRLSPYFDDVVVWDNSRLPDRKVYGRYEAAKRAKHDVVFTVDDDALVDPGEVLRHYQTGVITANMPMDRRPFYNDGIALLGWGSVFDRELVSAFDRYLSKWPADDLFVRECDRVFTALNRCHLIDVPFEHLPHAHGSDRMGAERNHLADLAEVRRRINAVRG